MTRTKSCDNVDCYESVLINRYGNVVDKDAPKWVTVEQCEVTVYNEETEEDDIISSGLELEFCSLTCAATELDRIS